MKIYSIKFYLIYYYILMSTFKKDYDKQEEQNDVTLVGIDLDSSIYSVIINVISNILSNLKFTIFPIILESINYIFIGNYGDYSDTISYSISILYINIIGLSFGIGIIDSFDEIDIKRNIALIKENPNSSLKMYYDCTKFYLYLLIVFISLFSYFSKYFLIFFNFNEIILDKTEIIIKISIFSNFFILMHFFNLKILRISNLIKYCDKVNITLILLHLIISYLLFNLLENKIIALALSVLLSSFLIYVLSSYYVSRYAIVKASHLSFEYESIPLLGLNYFKIACLYGLGNLINYLFFAVFIVLSIYLSDFEFAINSIIGNFMRLYFSLDLAMGLSYKYFHDFNNSNIFIENHSRVFYYVYASTMFIVSIFVFCFHNYITDIYTSNDIIKSGVNSVLIVYPFYFILEGLICMLEQSYYLQKKKKYKRYNPITIILNIIAIIIFSPIAGLLAFYWEFSYGGIWISYFELIVFKFFVYLIINLFKF